MEDSEALAFSTRVNQGAVKARSVAYMNGWHFACPVCFPGGVGILATSGWAQLGWLGFTFGAAACAIALHQIAPWWMDDYVTEQRTPRYFTDIVSDDLTPWQRLLNQISSGLEVKK